MNRLSHKLHNFTQRKHRVRANVQGTAERPRLSVSISNLHVTAQIINDETHTTLAYVSTVGGSYKGTMTERAASIGEAIAKKAKTAKVTKVVFDRNGRLYHGRVKALADAARKSGLEF